LCDSDVVRRLVEGFGRHNIPCAALENPEDAATTTIQFEGAQESYCSLTATVSFDKLTVHRVIGKGVIVQTFDLQDIDEHFFELIRDHYDTIRGLIKMYQRFLDEP